MTKRFRILIALLACAFVLIGYSAISVNLGLRNGGGYLLLILLFTLLGGIWRAIVNPRADKDKNDMRESENDSPVHLSADEGSKKSAVQVPVNDNPRRGSSLETKEQGEAKASSQPLSSDYHTVLKVMLIIIMAVGVLIMMFQFINDMIWENYTRGAIRFLLALLTFAGFILLYLKKFMGFLIIVATHLFGIIYSAFMHAPDIGAVIIAAIFRLSLVSALLFIKKDRVSGWRILLIPYRDTFKKLRLDIPLHPLIKVDAVDDGKKDTLKCDIDSNSKI